MTSPRFCIGWPRTACVARVLLAAALAASAPWAWAREPAPAAPAATAAPTWTVLGNDASVATTRDEGWSRRGQAAVDYRYAVGPGQVSVLVLPLAGGALAQAAALRFAARSSHATSLMIALEEQGGGRWSAPVTLNANEWQDVEIAFADLVLATGGDAPADANGRLDLERVMRITVVDVGAMLASKSADITRLFGIAAGPRRVALADWRLDAAVPAATAAGALDGFERPTPPWSAFGAVAVRRSTTPPLSAPGLVVDYRKAMGVVMSLMRPVPVGALAGAEAIEVTAASRIKTQVVLKLEQRNGDKFEAPLELAGDSALHTTRLRPADFKRSDDSASRRDRPDWALASNLMLMDIGGWLASRGDNRLSVQRLAAIGGGGARDGAAVSAATAERETPSTSAQPTVAVAVAVAVADVRGWSRWSKRAAPILSGPFSLVGDPSVIHDGPIYRMAYTCYDPKRKGPALCGATSSDGLSWADVPVPGPVPGRLLQTRPGQWDDTHETPFLMKFNGEYLLYFAGYRDRGGHFKSFPLEIGLATSRDGVHFERAGDDPVLKVSPGGFDSDAVFSPTITEYDGSLVMLYTAYCTHHCQRDKGVYLMAATSRNGRDWVKRDTPVLSRADVKAKDGVAEAEVVKGPDGQYYLFATLLYGGDRGHEITVARAASPFGPWRFAPEPIVRRAADAFDDIGPIAPSVLIEGDRVRMWFHGFGKRKTIQIGYAQAPWPLSTDRSPER